MRRLGAVLAALLLVGVVAGVAYASIPDPQGVIHACRKNSDGQLRVIDSATTSNCPNGWTPLNWSQAGPPGTDGVSGYELISASESVAIGAVPADLAVEAFCSSGKKALGGGGVAPSDQDASVTWVLTRSQPISDGTSAVGWRVQAHRFGPAPTTAGNLSAYAVCTTVTEE
jgi:hypothetical protein